MLTRRRVVTMKLKMFDKVILKTGETAYVVEIYNHGEAYEMDIDQKDGSIVTDTVRPNQIERKCS